MTDFMTRARAAEQVMRSVFPATPLQRNAHLSDRYGADIWLKREDLSPVRSYKIRGAFNAMRKQQGQDLFVCASAGNHAQGVAYMCKHLNVRGVIFMPVTTPQQKIQKTRIFGGDNIEIHLTGDYFDDTLAAAHAESGDFDEAVKWAEKALEVAPEDKKKLCEEQITRFKNKEPFRSQAGKNAEQNMIGG